MTGFSEYMRRSKRPEWATSYLDYSSLKTLLEKFAERRSQLHTIKTSEELERFVSQSKFNINVSSDYFNPDWRDDFSVASCSESRFSILTLTSQIALLGEFTFNYILLLLLSSYFVLCLNINSNPIFNKIAKETSKVCFTVRT